MALTGPTKELVLTIVVPGYWADDLDAAADEHFGGSRFDTFTDDQGVSEYATLTMLATGDESGPMVQAFNVRIVDVATRPCR